MNAFVVSGLIKRRAELAGEIERTREALRKMVLDLENLARVDALRTNPSLAPHR
jgi:hypothetical protein